MIKHPLKVYLGQLVLSCLALLIVGCGGGGGGSDVVGVSNPAPPEGQVGRSSVAIKSVTLGQDDPECPNGGITVESGIDDNGNGILDADEVDVTKKVCNGKNGSDGISAVALVKTSTEPVGANCSQGGILVETGTDFNGNLVLDAEEVSNSNYVCNGISSQPVAATPNTGSEVTSAKLLSNPIATQIAVGETATTNIVLEINANGYDANDPLVIKLSDDQGYFPTTYHNVTDFSKEVSLPLVSRAFAEATSVTTQIRIEFCQNSSCVEKAYGPKAATITIAVSPRFNSATSLIDNIDTTVVVSTTSVINLKMEIDAEGYNLFKPLYVSVSDSGHNVQSTTFPVYDTAQPVTLAMQTQYLYSLGEFNSKLSVNVCSDFGCSEKLQNPITIPVHLSVRNPIILSAPAKSNLSLSQTILESSKLNYEISLTSDDTLSSFYWVKVYESTGKYFSSKTVSSNFSASTPITVGLDLGPIDASATEVRTFKIESIVCMDSSCKTVLSPQPGTTEVTLNIVYPSAELTVAETVIDAVGKDNTPTVKKLTGTWQSHNLGSLSAYLVATDTDGGNIVNTGQLLPNKNDFDVPFELLPQKQISTYRTNVRFKVCLELSCQHLIGTSANEVAVTHDVNRLAGWTTHQRNAEHNGYIPITLDKNKFTEQWTWKRPSGSEPIGGINPVVAQNGKVVLTYDVYFGEAKVVMLDEVTGSKTWEANLGVMPALNPPALTDGKVWAATTGHQDTFLRAFDFDTGSELHKSAFGAQWPQYLAPTPYANTIYQGGAYYGGDVSSYNTNDGQTLWTASLGGAWDMYTPAVFRDYVLHQNGAILSAINRRTGDIEFQIDDTRGTSSGYSYHGSPIVYGQVALAYAGGAFSGRASSNVEQYDSRPLSAFDLASRTYLWSSENSYLTQPAVKDGVVYIGSKSLGRLDALDIATGKILWSWKPIDTNETEMHRNVIVTDNLVFVSTNLKVHAIDIGTKSSVWNYPSPGMLAISDNKTLLIVTGARESNGNLAAIKLE